MLKKFRKIWNRDLWQPLIDKAFTRLVLALRSGEGAME